MRVYTNLGVEVINYARPCAPQPQPACVPPPKPKQTVKPKSREIGTKLFVLFLLSLLSIPLGFTIYSVPFTFVILVVACWIGGYFEP